jgi:hypothetical protein
MDQPTPERKRSDWPVVVFLSVAVIAIAAVCIVYIVQ